MNNECVSCGRTAAAGSVRCGACGGSRFRVVRAAGYQLKRGNAASKAPVEVSSTPKCASCGARLASETSTCSDCGSRPARALSDAELLAELRDLVSRPRATPEQERADVARREARRFAQSRAGLLDVDRPASPRRYTWLNTVFGPVRFALPTPAREQSVPFLDECARIERAVGRSW
jgi:hypothetical protein